MSKVAKSKRSEAERASEWILRKNFGCVDTRRALRTKFARVDFFGADTIGVEPDGSKHWIQVTAGQVKTSAVYVRRKKIERYTWHSSDKVAVWQLVSTADPARPSRKKWFFRVWNYVLNDEGGRDWEESDEAILIEDKKWFTAYKDEKDTE